MKQECRLAAELGLGQEMGCRRACQGSVGVLGLAPHIVTEDRRAQVDEREVAGPCGAQTDIVRFNIAVGDAELMQER